jgi:hypothetical protein
MIGVRERVLIEVRIREGVMTGVREGAMNWGQA